MHVSFRTATEVEGSEVQRNPMEAVQTVLERLIFIIASSADSNLKEAFIVFID